ncbi:hypothetical protein ACFYT4_09690 [Streptomyces sp. NPDC004609]|uniref:hypothetical protein n=1 Tax=Streptomyces sp. NPDC004609 TaxID=3364704 RepID=UPI00369A6085
MAAWSGETVIEASVVRRPGRRGGIAYAEELPTDRGESGALLHRGRRPAPHGGRGRPLFAGVHPNRQRRAMKMLLCHLCGQPASHTPEHGVLWLLGGGPGGREPGWPEGAVTTYPPVCLPCATQAIRQCPHLFARGHTAIRVRYPRSYGYHGRLYTPDLTRPGSPTLLVVEETVDVPFDDPRLPWLLAAQLVVRLTGCTPVEL